MNITLNLHMLFVDLNQAFDSTKRIQIYEILQQTGIPAKLVRLIKEGRNVLGYNLSEGVRSKAKWHLVNSSL